MSDYSDNLRHNIAAVVLAAGTSSRLNRPKQLLILNGKTLIQHSVETALKITKQVVVVTGAYADDIQKELKGFAIKIVSNLQYAEGIASSIRTGVSSVKELYPDSNHVFLLVCDQPYISESLLQDLIAKREGSRKGIIASSYQDTIGTPALFNQKYFRTLLSLKGDVGAKKVMMQHQEDLETVSFSMGHIDIDTEEDYRQVAE